jgi:hypothetical protein
MIDKLFDEEEETKEGMTFGRNKNVDDINKYVKPLLNTIGLDLTPLVGEEEIRRNFPLGQHRIWSSFEMRFQKGGSGNLYRIFSIEDPRHNLTSQIFILENTKAETLGTRARFNIPRNIVDITSGVTRVTKMLSLLEGTKVYLFLFIKPASYVLIKYSDIPIEGWNLTYRGKNKALNRMYVKTDYLERCYKHQSKLEVDLKSKL